MKGLRELTLPSNFEKGVGYGNSMEQLRGCFTQLEGIFHHLILEKGCFHSSNAYAHVSARLF